MQRSLRIGVALVSAGILLPGLVLGVFVVVARAGQSGNYGFAFGAVLAFWISLVVACALLGIGAVTLAIGLARAQQPRPRMAIVAALVGAMGFVALAALLPLMASGMS